MEITRNPRILVLWVWKSSKTSFSDLPIEIIQYQICPYLPHFHERFLGEQIDRNIWEEKYEGSPGWELGIHREENGERFYRRSNCGLMNVDDFTFFSIKRKFSPFLILDFDVRVLKCAEGYVKFTILENVNLRFNRNKRSYDGSGPLGFWPLGRSSIKIGEKWSHIRIISSDKYIKVIENGEKVFSKEHGSVKRVDMNWTKIVKEEQKVTLHLQTYSMARMLCFDLKNVMVTLYKPELEGKFFSDVEKHEK